MTHELMQLPYEYDALEPHIDAQTMEIHYSKHHQGYVDKLNAALVGHEELANKSVEELLKDLSAISQEIKQAVINNAGGVSNHNFFWTILKADSAFNDDSEIGKAILEKFESLENFKILFSKAAATVFGSGWAWLVLKGNELEIVQTKNQDSPISQNMIPILGLDVWEHAYYLKYQNKRPDYIQGFFNVINWEKINEIYIQAKQ